MNKTVTIKREQLESLLEINDLLLERCRELKQEVRDSKQLLREIRKTYFEILELEAKKDLGIALTVAVPRTKDRQGSSKSVNPPILEHQVNVNWEEMKRLYRQSLKVKERLRDWSGIAEALYQLAIIEHQRGNYDQAEELYYQNLELNKDLEDRKGMTATIQRLAVIQQERGEYDKTKQLFEKSMTVAERLQDQQKEEFPVLRKLTTVFTAPI